MLSKAKQQCEERNWLDLPSDLMLNILQRLGVSDRLLNAQLVCTAWREICKDPVMWRIVYIDHTCSDPFVKVELYKMCKHIVDISQGQLLDLTLNCVCNDDHDEILQYVADRSSQLRRLELVYYYDKILGETLKKLPLLEELSLVRTDITKGEIEAVGRFCPLLKTLKAILDGCCHLETLDLRHCWYIDLKGELGKRCSQQIKHLKLPHDSLVGSGCPHADKLVDSSLYDSDDYEYEDFDVDDLFDSSEDEYDGLP